MAIIYTENVKEDMVLSEDVKDVKGRLLLKEGQKIEPKHIKILRMWGISEVNVACEAGAEEETESVIDPLLLEKVTEDVARDFRYVDADHPAMKEIFRLTVLHRSQQGVSKEESPISPPDEDDHASELKLDVRQKIMNKEVTLPEIPAIVFELNEVMADPMSSADDVAQIVSKSPSLATILLKIVNSSFYGFPSKIDNISRAVTIIGTREIGSLALGISVIKIFEGIGEDLIDMKQFLRHCFSCGIISRILAAQKGLAQTEQLFVAGLLHDIGRAIIYKYFPIHSRVLLSRSMASYKLVYKEERECLGCRHTDISRFLLKKWKLPITLESNISYHHRPSAARDPEQAAIVHLADIISNALGLGSSGERLVPPLDLKAWDRLGISPSYFDVVIRQAISQLSVFENFLKQKEE